MASTVTADTRRRPAVQAPQPPAPGTPPETPPLRLTRRGRVVAAAAGAVLVAAVSMAAAGVAQATSHALPRRIGEVQIVVRSGQNLWSIAQAADPGADPRAVSQQIIELNSLTSYQLYPGEQLWVPRG